MSSPNAITKKMPTPALMTVSKASEHDLPVAKAMLDDVKNIRLFGDSAFELTHLQLV